MTLDDDGQLGVRLVGADNRAEFAQVSLLRDSDDGAWLAGLPQEAAVIVSGQEYLIDGVALEVTYRDNTP